MTTYVAFGSVVVRLVQIDAHGRVGRRLVLHRALLSRTFLGRECRGRCALDCVSNIVQRRAVGGASQAPAILLQRMVPVAVTQTCDPA